jgi:hypothetical protein
LVATVALGFAAACSRLDAPTAGHDDHGSVERLGTVHFETSCAPDQAAAFDRAVALLHSFAYATANSAFQGVSTADPRCAMAHWGSAMAYWGNPFAGLKSGPGLTNGRAAAERGLATGAPTPRERGYLEAVAELYRDFETVDQRTRALAYERAMAAVHQANPGDMEAAIFYGLSVNQTMLPTDKTFAQQLKAAAIFEPLFRDHPDHPGLAHYIIHAFDHPPLADRALPAARRYASIAPAVPHALPMPSHTFTRVGAWQESVTTNIASAEAALKATLPAEALHAMDYQAYAYLQMGQDADADRVLHEATDVFAARQETVLGGAAPPTAGVYAMAAIPARLALERGDWKAAAALEARSTPVAYADAVTHFARALGAARSGAPASATADLSRLAELQKALAGKGDAYWAEQARIQHEIGTAWVEYASGRQAAGLARLQRAADAEDATDKSAVSPGPIAPARELLADMLLDMNRHADALAAYEAVMNKERGRFRATYGAAVAAARAGQAAKARDYYRTLTDIAKSGDAPGRPALAEARQKAAETSR